MTSTVYPVGTQLRVLKNLEFGIGRVTESSPGVVTLENRNEEIATVSTDLTTPAPVLSVGAVITDAVKAIKAQIIHMNTRHPQPFGQLPFVRTFAELHDHMDANVLLLNHVPEMFAPDAEYGEEDDRQVDLENRVMEMVNAWLMERWDNDPYHQPAPTEPEQIAGILLAMLNMSHDEIQWGDAKRTAFSREAGPKPTVRMEIDGVVFMAEIHRVDPKGN
jgi:hypothetical protein